MPKQRVLVIAAHADDEILGCGGTMARHAQTGAEVAALFMTNGVGSRDSVGQEEIDRRNHAMRSALSLVGVTKCVAFDFPDNGLDRVSLLEVVKSIEGFVSDWGMPDIVYTHHPGDLNVDHQLSHRAALTCFRPQPNTQGNVCEILSFEVLSSTGWYGISAAEAFRPNYFVDVTDTLDSKLRALRAYNEEMRQWPHARSLKSAEHLARTRGSMMGLEAAEAFVVERIIRPV